MLCFGIGLNRGGNDMDRSTLIEAKRVLYHEILTYQGKLTQNEIELGYLLARDRDIQDILDKAFKKEVG
jgi:hypothetical protein